MSLRAVRNGAWMGVAIAALAALILFMLPARQSGGPVVRTSDFGGPFQLIDQRGETVTEADLSGHASALFFGYTFCPDVCPTTLFEASLWLDRLGEGADKIRVYFVTVDPERDTPEVLGEYLQAFDPRITGLSGAREAVDEIIAGYGVVALKVAGEGGDYTMDHTASVFLLDADASLVGTISYQEDPDVAMTKLRNLIGRS